MLTHVDHGENVGRGVGTQRYRGRRFLPTGDLKACDVMAELVVRRIAKIESGVGGGGLYSVQYSNIRMNRFRTDHIISPFVCNNKNPSFGPARQ